MKNDGYTYRETTGIVIVVIVIALFIGMMIGSSKPLSRSAALEYLKIDGEVEMIEQSLIYTPEVVYDDAIVLDASDIKALNRLILSFDTIVIRMQ